MAGGPSVDQWMARHRKAIRGYRAIHGWPGSTVGPERVASALSPEAASLAPVVPIRKAPTPEIEAQITYTAKKVYYKRPK